MCVPVFSAVCSAPRWHQCRVHFFPPSSRWRVEMLQLWGIKKKNPTTTAFIIFFFPYTRGIGWMIRLCSVLWLSFFPLVGGSAGVGWGGGRGVVLQFREKPQLSKYLPQIRTWWQWFQHVPWLPPSSSHCGPCGVLQGHFIPYMVSYIIKSFALHHCIASTSFHFLRNVWGGKKSFCTTASHSAGVRLIYLPHMATECLKDLIWEFTPSSNIRATHIAN